MAFDLQFVDSIGDLIPEFVDTFSRTAAGDWGAPWAVSRGDAADVSVNGSQGLIAVDTIDDERHMTVELGTVTQDVRTWCTVPITPAGSAVNWGVLLRWVDADNYVWADAQVGTDSSITVRLIKRTAGNPTVLASVLTDVTHSTTVPRVLRAQVDEAGNVRARVWSTSEPVEPNGWHATFLDPALPAGTRAGVIARLMAGNANTLPVEFRFDNVRASSPANVRLDLNDRVTWRTLADGTDFGMPALSRAVSSTLLTDGDHVSAAAYGNRVLTLALKYEGTDLDAAAAAVQTLAREVDRPFNLLRYRPGTSKPVCFRTLRSDITAVRWDPFAQTATVSVLAEPFAYGMRERLPSATVSNDPAEGQILNANPFFEADASGWMGVNATITRSTVQKREGWAALQITPNGSSATGGADATARVPVSPGGDYRAAVWAYTTASMSVGPAVDWYNAGGTLISTSLVGPSTPTPSTWTLLSGVVSAPAGAVTATMRARHAGTPPASSVWFVDEVRLAPVGRFGTPYFDVTDVKGDVQTPVVLHRPTTGIGVESLFAVRRRGNPTGVPLLLQAESMTQGTDTATQLNSGTFSGSANNYSRITFTTIAAEADRLTVTNHPATASVDARGQYRVFARLRRNGTTSTIKVRLRWAGADLPDVTVTGTAVQMVDLTGTELVSIPTGADPVFDGPSWVDLPARGPSVSLRASRSGAGSDTLDVDYLLFVPADDRLCIVHWPVTTAGRVVVDGLHDLVYASAGDVTSGTPGYHVGGLPMLSPGQTNRIFVVNEVAVGQAEPSFPTVVTFDGYYWPRYLMVRGAS